MVGGRIQIRFLEVLLLTRKLTWCCEGNEFQIHDKIFVFSCPFQVWTDADVLAVQPEDAPVLLGDHQQHQRGPRPPLQGRQFLLQRGEQAPGHGGAWHGGREHGEHSAGLCFHEAAVCCRQSPVWVLGRRVASFHPAVIARARPKYSFARTLVPVVPGGLGWDVFGTRLEQALRTRDAQRARGRSTAQLWRAAAVRTHERGQKERTGVTAAPVVGLLITVQSLRFYFCSPLYRVTTTSLCLLRRNGWGMERSLFYCVPVDGSLCSFLGSEEDQKLQTVKTVKQHRNLLRHFGVWWLRNTGGVLPVQPSFQI